MRAGGTDAHVAARRVEGQRRGAVFGAREVEMQRAHRGGPGAGAEHHAVHLGTGLPAEGAVPIGSAGAVVGGVHAQATDAAHVELVGRRAGADAHVATVGVEGQAGPAAQARSVPPERGGAVQQSAHQATAGGGAHVQPDPVGGARAGVGRAQARLAVGGHAQARAGRAGSRAYEAVGAEQQVLGGGMVAEVVGGHCYGAAALAQAHSGAADAQGLQLVGGRGVGQGHGATALQAQRSAAQAELLHVGGGGGLHGIVRKAEAALVRVNLAGHFERLRGRRRADAHAAVGRHAQAVEQGVGGEIDGEAEVVAGADLRTHVRRTGRVRVGAGGAARQFGVIDHQRVHAGLHTHGGAERERGRRRGTECDRLGVNLSAAVAAARVEAQRGAVGPRGLQLDGLNHRRKRQQERLPQIDES